MVRRAPIYGTLLLALGVVMGILLAGTPSGAEAPLATLTVAPGADVKPGESVSFSVEIPYSDPAPVVAVMVDGAMWSTERQSVTFPGVGRPATVKFTKAYPVPPDAKPGTAICFVLVKGEEKSRKKELISQKQCVLVKDSVTFQPAKKVDPAKFVLMPDLVVADAHIDSNNVEIVHVKVVNQGQGDAGESVLCVQVRLWSGGGSKQLANRQAKVPPLKAGQELWLSVDTGVLGTFFYEFTADCKNDLKEVNESNNVGYLDRTIK